MPNAPNITIHPITNGINAFFISAFSSAEPIINLIPKIPDIKTANAIPIYNKILYIVAEVSFSLLSSISIFSLSPAFIKPSPPFDYI